MSEAETLVNYNRYLLKQLGVALDEDRCTAEGGHWVTIRGTHVCIQEGETAEEAFKRTTGKELEPDKTPKDLKGEKPVDKVVKDMIEGTESDMKKLFGSGSKGEYVEKEQYEGKVKDRYSIVLYRDEGIVVRHQRWRKGKLVRDKDAFYTWIELRNSVWSYDKPSKSWYGLLAQKVAKKRGLTLEGSD